MAFDTEYYKLYKPINGTSLYIEKMYKQKYKKPP